MPYDLPLLGGHTPRSDEGSKKVHELIDLCTKLTDKVTSLEKDLKQTKKLYGKAIRNLVKKVKHLEDKLKSTIERRKARLVISDDDEDLGSEDTSKQGRMIETKYERVKIDLNQTDDDLQRRSIIKEIDLAKILADASRERVKTYTRRRSTNSLRDNTTGGLFSTAEAVQGKEHISTNEKVAQKLKDEEMARAAAREEHERANFEKALDFKKLRAAEALKPEPIQEQPTEEPKELSEEELKKMLKLVSVEEFKAEALQIKYLIIDWEIHTEASRKYWKIIKVGNITEAYQVFEDMLQGFDREDLVTLWSLVKERFSSAEPTKDKERAFIGRVEETI
ncbi:hypothetical protein Tco_1363106 [Tanacetum coccineum]